MGIVIGKYYNGSSNRFVNDRDTVNNAVRRNADIEKTSNIGISNTKLPANPLSNNSTQSNHSGNPELIKLSSFNVKNLSRHISMVDLKISNCMQLVGVWMPFDDNKLKTRARIGTLYSEIESLLNNADNG